MNLDTKLQYGKCFELLKRYITKPVILCGYGVTARLFMGIMAELEIPLLAVCDKNKAGQAYEYITPGTITTYEALKEINEDAIVLITSEKYYEQIRDEVMLYSADSDMLELEKIKEIYHEIPECFHLPEPYIYRKYLEKNNERLDRVIAHLQDELSKETLIKVINTRLTWNEEYTKEICVEDMYFIPELQLGKHEVFIDGGAYDGDTAQIFINKVDGQFEKIYCVEPNEENHCKLQKVKEEYPDEQIEMIPMGLSDVVGEVYFSGEEKGYHISECGSKKMPVTTIDTLELEPTFIKLDIQGVEMDALKGSIATIRKCRPKLAVCVYHKMEDLLDIAEWLLDLGLDYKLMIRHHAEDVNDTVLYAV